MALTLRFMDTDNLVTIVSVINIVLWERSAIHRFAYILCKLTCLFSTLKVKFDLAFKILRIKEN